MKLQDLPADSIDADVNELDALKALIASDGWQLYQQAIRGAWGAEACMRQIDQALAGLPRGDQDAVNDTVQQIRASARAVQAMATWPESRVQTLQAQKPKAKGLAAWRRA